MLLDFNLVVNSSGAEIHPYPAASTHLCPVPGKQRYTPARPPPPPPSVKCGHPLRRYLLNLPSIPHMSNIICNSLSSLRESLCYYNSVWDDSVLLYYYTILLQYYDITIVCGMTVFIILLYYTITIVCGMTVFYYTITKLYYYNSVWDDSVLLYYYNTILLQ